jgi:hypothetical protein
MSNVITAEYLRNLNPVRVYARMKRSMANTFIDIFEIKIMEAARAGRTSATSSVVNYSVVPNIKDTELEDLIIDELYRRFPGCRIVYSESFGYTVDWESGE